MVDKLFSAIGDAISGTLQEVIQQHKFKVYDGSTWGHCKCGDQRACTMCKMWACQCGSSNCSGEGYRERKGKEGRQWGPAKK